MPRPQAATWRVALRLAVALTGVSAFVVFGGGTALWLVEGSRPGSTMQSWGDGLWLAVSTLTTVGYGDHVPQTPAGRWIAAGVMVIGVAIAGAVAAMVALGAARRVAIEEEQAFEAEAGTLERRIEARLDRIEAQLARLDARLDEWSTRPEGNDPPRGPR